MRKAGKKNTVREPPASPGPARAFPLLLGVFLGLALLKFGNPPIFEEFVTPPEDAYQFVLGFPWPIPWSYALLAVVAVFGLWVRFSVSPSLRLSVSGILSSSALRERRVVTGVIILPLAWFAWQLVSATASVAPPLTVAVLPYFLATVACFYLGFFVLSTAKTLWSFWTVLLLCFWLMIIAGWSQQFGGLEQTRNYFFQYLYPQMKEVSPDYLKKIASNRIFGTLFYPNALAGALILLLPPLLAAVLRMSERLTIGARAFVAGATVVGGLGCLVWSGSKGGWLIMLVLALLVLLRLPFNRRAKMALVLVFLLGGLTGFVWRYAGFFQKGATSVGARFDYWRAAAQITASYPLLGTGPGTFGTAYTRIKHPESEPARLTHNDYLEQAADSGLPGMLLYTAFIVGALYLAYPKRSDIEENPWGRDEEWQDYATWLGVLGWSLQSAIEFGLYIPALAWPAFSLLGWLLAGQVRRRMKILNQSV